MVSEDEVVEFLTARGYHAVVECLKFERELRAGALPVGAEADGWKPGDPIPPLVRPAGGSDE